MDLRNKTLIITSICLSTLSYIRCDPVNIDVTTPCKDVAEGINRVHIALKDRMPLEARCKRYAVFLSMADKAGVTNELALLQLSLLREEILDWLYGEINIEDLAARYIAAIDVYRATRLGPAFIDLIECLKDIPTSVVKAYLSNPELKLLEELYRRALASPADEIDLESVDLSAYNSEFRTTLERLFEGHSETLSQVPDPNSTGQIDLFNQLSSSYLPRRLLAEKFIQDTEERVRRECMERERLLTLRLRHSAQKIDCDTDRQEEESVRQQRTSIEKCREHELPETIEDPRLKRLAHQWNQRREAKRRYRERNREHLRVIERDRQRRRRQLIAEQVGLMMQSHPVREPVSVLELSRDQQQQEREQGFLKLLLSPLDQSASKPRPTIIESSLVEQREYPVEVQPKEQTSEQPLWLERLEKLEKTISRERERVRKYREENLEIVRERQREWKRQWRQKVRARQQKQVNQSASTSRMLNWSLTGQQVAGADIQPGDQVLDQQLWLERLEKSEKTRSRKREYRVLNPQLVREREREWKRKWRQKVRARQQKQSASTSRMLDLSLTGQQVDGADIQPGDQILDQQLWREIIYKSESAARRSRERERGYRKQKPLRERQQEEVDQLLDELDGSGEPALSSDSEQKDE